MSAGHLLPSGQAVPFAEASALLAENQARSRAAARNRALTATIVVVGPADRLREASQALCDLEENVGLRSILISLGSNPTPPVEVRGCAIALDGIKPEYANNVVAALRLSSLPTMIWWRGGDPNVMGSVVDLAERVVLDEASDPEPAWQCAVSLLSRVAFSDLRWARLTRWRALTAHFFDAPGVRAAIPSIQRVVVAGSDRPCAALFAGWLRSAFDRPSMEVDVKVSAAGPPIEEIRVESPSLELVLRVATGHKCVEASASSPDSGRTSRTVELGDERLPALLAEELKVRSHDLAFERALRAVVPA